MDEGIIVGREGDLYWVVESSGGRRYFLRDSDIVGVRPRVGQKGQVGYVQRPSALVMTFIASPPSADGV